MRRKRGCLAGISILLLAFIVLLLVIQIIPYGKNHANPPVVQEPNWDSPQTRALAVRACFDCHSNETTWPWYSNIAPVSWLVYWDVQEGRQRLNFSDINGTQRTGRGEGGEGSGGGEGRGGDEMARVIEGGSMPPWYYILQHPTAGLSTAEKPQLIQGLQATLGNR
ncbi:MAG TPA: heme-binding domain-containing protein [Anaerolineales bacterium]